MFTPFHSKFTEKIYLGKDAWEILLSVIAMELGARSCGYTRRKSVGSGPRVRPFLPASLHATL